MWCSQISCELLSGIQLSWNNEVVHRYTTLSRNTAHDNLCLSLLCNCSVSTNYSLVWTDFPGCHLRPCCSWQWCFTLDFSLSIPFCLQKLSVWKITHQDKQRDSFSDRSVLWAGSPHGETFVLPGLRMWGSTVRAWQLLQQPELGLRQTVKLQLLKINWRWGDSKRNKWELLNNLFYRLYSLSTALHLLHCLPWESQR